jgi:membrane protease subunit (stomatin/prohibitin family)
MAFIDRIKFDAVDNNLLVWKYPSESITVGCQLIVNQSQEAILFKGGKALDIFGPGTHTLSTGNIPLLNKLINLPFGGETPFTAEVWFVNKTAIRDLKWGTLSPIPLIDPKYNYPISARAFGRWGLRVSDTRSFIVQLVGTEQYKNSAEIEQYFEGEIVQRLSNELSNYLVKENISVFEVNSKLNDLSKFVENDVSHEFDRFGIEVVNFNVERISIPDEEKLKIQDILGKRMEIEQISQASVGSAYITMRSLDVLEKAAQNEGGAAGSMLAGGLGLGMGMGAGIPLGQNIGQSLSVNQNTQGQALNTGSITEKLKQLKELLDIDLISQSDFDEKKRDLLKGL